MFSLFVEGSLLRYLQLVLVAMRAVESHFVVWRWIPERSLFKCLEVTSAVLQQILHFASAYSVDQTCSMTLES